MTIKRRIFIMILAVVLLMSCSIPVSAADVEIPVDYIELLDYYTIPFRNLSNGSHVITYDLPRDDIFYGVDMLIQAPYGLNAVAYVHPSLGDVSLNFVSIGNGYHRVYGDVPMTAGSTISLKYTVDSPYGTDNLQIVSFKVSYTSGYAFPTPVSGSISFGNSSHSTFHWNSDTDHSAAIIPGTSEFDNTFHAAMSVPDWRKYDFLDIQLIVSTGEIFSLIASVTSTYADSVPVSVSYLNTGSGLGDYLVHILVDLSQVRRWDPGEFEIVLTGGVGFSNTEYTSVGVFSCSGYLDTSPNPLFYYFKILTNNLSNMFGQLSSWIQAQTNAIGQYFSDLKTNLSGWFRSLNNSIDDWGQAIVDAITGDSSAADEFQQQIDDSNQQLNDMAQVMDSFTTPDIDSIDIDVGAFVTPSDLNSLSVPMSKLFESSIITTCIMISLILGTVMFVFFGKR